jgi:hypothetical protein
VLGCPIRTSTDRSLVDSSPWLIAVAHVLLRLQAPRHPPLALYSLENKDARARSGILKGPDGTRSPHLDYRCSGTHGASGPAERPEVGPGIAERRPDGRSLKTEERGPTPPVGADPVSDGLPGPRRATRPRRNVGGGPASAGIPVRPSNQCSTG